MKEFEGKRPLPCSRCGKGYPEGTKIYRSTTGRFYCEKCFNEIHIEVE